MGRLGEGRLTVVDGDGRWEAGPGGGPAAVVRVHDPRAYRALALRGTLGAADSYLAGEWDGESLVDVFRVLARNLDVLTRLDGPAARAFRGLAVRAHALRQNSVTGSRRNIAAHYDLGDDFFATFLDETMTYSAGVFLRPADTLADASREKYDRACRKLRLGPGHHVLEIGTGWGGFAVHAARHYGCRVTTTTISRRQREYARARVRREGLEGRVTVLGEDYRTLTGRYDHLVSIEMIEAVGYRYLDGYFRACGRLLRPDGMMLLQAITVPDYRFARYVRSVEFLQRHVFPGGCVPSIGSLAAAVGRATDFRMIHQEDFAPHYAETLARWRGAFLRNLDRVRGLGFDERFVRMWHYYLAYCEAGFRENVVGVSQILYARPQCHRPPVLWRGEDECSEPESMR